MEAEGEKGLGGGGVWVVGSTPAPPASVGSDGRGRESLLTLHFSCFRALTLTLIITCWRRHAFSMMVCGFDGLMVQCCIHPNAHLKQFLLCVSSE